MLRRIGLSILLVVLSLSALHGQQSDFSFRFGLVGAKGENDSNQGGLWGIGFQRSFQRRVALDVSLESFRAGSDENFETVQASLVVYPKKWNDRTPAFYFQAGIAALSDDFTELGSHLLFRGGGGFRSQFSRRLGIRLGLVADMGNSNPRAPAPVAGSRLLIVGVQLNLLWAF